MREIGSHFLDRGNAVKPGLLGYPETTQLRKHEPHPVAPLPPRPQFGEHRLKDRRLRRHKAFQIEAVIRGHLRSLRCSTISARANVSRRRGLLPPPLTAVRYLCNRKNA